MRRIWGCCLRKKKRERKEGEKVGCRGSWGWRGGLERSGKRCGKDEETVCPRDVYVCVCFGRKSQIVRGNFVSPFALFM